MAFKTGTWTRKTEVAKDAMTNIQKVNHSEQIYIWWIMRHHLKKSSTIQTLGYIANGLSIE